MEQIQQISLSEIYPCEGNRRYGGFDQTKLQELADSIRTAGVLQPAVVRERVNGQGRYELVAGERRWRAAELAGLQVLPCVIRDLDDVTVLKIQTIENLQREDLHPLDESDGYARLIERAGYDVEHLAQEVGRSASYVYQRLKLRDLVDEAKQKLIDGVLTASHAILIARLQEKQQNEAIKWTCSGWNAEEVCSVRSLDQWIHRQFYLDLQKTAFQKDDAALIPKAGTCTECPKRTGYAPALFPEIEKQDFCLDPKCFGKKCDAILARRREELKDEEFIEVCKGWEGCPKDALGEWKWEECRKKDEGAKKALIVNGTERGRLTWGREQKHEAYNRFDSPEEEAAWEEERRQEELQRKTRAILSQKVIEKLVEHYETMPAGSRISSETLLPFLLDEYLFDSVDDEEVLKKYGLLSEGEEPNISGDELLKKARNLPAERLEMFIIEYKLHEAAPGFWGTGEQFFALAAGQGIDVEALEAEAKQQAEQGAKTKEEAAG